MQALIEQFVECYNKSPTAPDPKRSVLFFSVMLHPHLLSRSFIMYQSTLCRMDGRIEPVLQGCLSGILDMIQPTYDALNHNKLVSNLDIDALRANFFKQLGFEIPTSSMSWNDCSVLQRLVDQDIEKLCQNALSYAIKYAGGLSFPEELANDLLDIYWHFLVNNLPVDEQVKKIVDYLEQLFIIQRMEKSLDAAVGLSQLEQRYKQMSWEQETRQSREELRPFVKLLLEFHEHPLGAYYLKHSVKFHGYCSDLVKEFGIPPLTSNDQLFFKSPSTIVLERILLSDKSSILPTSSYTSISPTTFFSIMLDFMRFLIDSLKSCCSFEQVDADHPSSLTDESIYVARK